MTDDKPKRDDYTPYRRIALWKAAVEAGMAGAACDRIVRSRPVPSALVDVLVQPTNTRGAPLPPLSVLEEDTLRLLAEGLTDVEIAERMYVPLVTAKSRMKQLREKLHARNSAHVVALGYELGYLGREAA